MSCDSEVRCDRALTYDYVNPHTGALTVAPLAAATQPTGPTRFYVISKWFDHYFFAGAFTTMHPK